jgi:hypothetical protein
MRRTWVLAAAGAVLVGSATILGLILFRKNGFFELTLPELTIWSVVVGTMTAAFLGLLFVEMKAPFSEAAKAILPLRSLRRRLRPHRRRCLLALR